MNYSLVFFLGPAYIITQKVERGRGGQHLVGRPAIFYGVVNILNVCLFHLKRKCFCGNGVEGQQGRVADVRIFTAANKYVAGRL